MEKLCIIIPAVDAQKGKKVLKGLDSWDGTRRLMTIEGTNLVAVPITTQHHDPGKLLDLVGEKISTHGEIREMELPAAKKLLVKTPMRLLSDGLTVLFEESGMDLREELRREIPDHWEKHGDLVLLPDTAFTSDDWKVFGDTLWQIVCRSLHCKRLARKMIVSRDGYRTPQVVLLYGDDGWVEHVDIGIRYTYDVTKCMFSSGNITEKLRVSRFDCSGEVVVDLYAGIGYFTLPYLVYTGVKHLHACEWNPNAVEALRRNVELNGVADRCTVHAGDNREVCPRYVADRVNLGLIPSSEPGWRTACLALRSQTGGILHIHGNVNTRKGCGENIIVDNHADSGENIIVDNHPDSDEKQIGAEHINSKSNGILVDGSHEEGFQSETNEARVDSDTKTCLSDEKARGIVKTLNEIDVTDMDDSNVTNEIRLDDDRDKSDFDKSLAETQELIASCTEGADQVNSPEKDILVAENKKLSFSNQESNHHFAEMEKLPDNCKILGNKDNAEEKRLVPEASACKSKWLPWALDVSGKMRNILKQVHKSEWETTILHIEYVKSYAPHVDHIVLDLKCNPLNQ